MIVLRDGNAASTRRPSCVAVGVFDGLHRGHQRVVATLVELAARHDATASVVTFDPHPAWVLSPQNAPRLLGTLDQRLEGLEALGVRQVRVVQFDAALAAQAPEDFVERVLVGELGAVAVVVGEDFRFGHERRGDVSLLEGGGTRWDFDVVAAPIYGGASRWSSTAVRRALGDGDLEVANDILGRAFCVRGVVEHGDARGADLGFPTANLALGPHQMIPGIGIYAGAARVEGGAWVPAAISVGTRPQFYEDGAILVEVHLPGYAGDLYDKRLDVAFIERLRGEATFASVTELVEQIARDVARTREIFLDFHGDASALLG